MGAFMAGDSWLKSRGLPNDNACDFCLTRDFKVLTASG